MPATAARRKATLIGGTAVMLWATLALLTTLTGNVPPFQLVAMSFAIGGGLALLKWIVRRQPIFAPGGFLRQPIGAWALGTGGLFLYHFFYFLALRSAPPVEAALINYLWPVLIVVFAAFLPGERLRWFHTVGVLAGLVGTVLLVTGGQWIAPRSEYVGGYLAAAACGVVWSGYSVLNRRYAGVPSESVGGFCLATAMLAAICHLLFEPTVWPQGAQWLAVVGLGVGPVGIAFFTWDYGCKHGDIQALGVAAYAAPLLSTLLLILFGQAALTWPVGIACLLITGGAVIASRDMWRRRD
ncbi:MAG: DMT family transporter [Alphaproteobacteria bacterium]